MTQPAPGKPAAPGLYTRLCVQTMYYGVFYSTWRKCDQPDIEALDVVVQHIEAAGG